MTAGRCFTPESSENLTLAMTTSPRLHVVEDGVIVVVPNGYEGRVLTTVDPSWARGAGIGGRLKATLSGEPGKPIQIGIG